MPTFFRPVGSVAADFIPFYWKGVYHLFYLRDYRDPAKHGEGTPWFHLSTRDFVEFADHGEALARGPIGSQDVWVFTGCVFEHEGLFHIFYTGHNSHFPKVGKPQQAVMHATSPDLLTWTKDPSGTFFAPDEGYEKDDWRDPFVFWNAEAGEFWMLLAARKKTGPSRFRGCVALCSSKDLKSWTVRDPFWAPDEYFTHECPDLFRIGDWWYLVYSTFSERCVTHYRMSRSLAGPWLAPANDTFDGRAYYAAKTAGDEGAQGNRRFVFGWLPTRDREKDDGWWQWGGDLVVHETRQNPDGTLRVLAPQSVLNQFGKLVSLELEPVLGQWNVIHESADAAPEPQGLLHASLVPADAIHANAVGRNSIITLGRLPDECLVETSIVFAPGTTSAGLLFRVGPTVDTYYQFRIEPFMQRVVIDRWSRPGDQPFMLERPVKLSPGEPVKIQALIDGTNLVIYVNEEVALSCRMYDYRTGSLGLQVVDGDATFKGTTVRVKA